MSKPNDTKRLIDLINRVSDPGLTAAELSELESMLRGGRGARQTYLRVMSIHSDLDQIAKMTLDEAADVDVAEVAKTFGSRARPAESLGDFRYGRLVWGAIAATAAAMLLFLSLPASDQAIRIAAVHRAAFDGAELPAINQTVSGDDQRLISGAVTLAYPDGSTVLIQAPAEFSVPSPRSLRLDRGTVTLRSDRPGFVVVVPAGRVIDRGTRIGVQVDDQQNWQVHVLAGRASVMTDGGASQPLEAGRAAMCSALDRQIEPIAFAASRFTPVGLDRLPRVRGDMRLNLWPPDSVRRTGDLTEQRPQIVMFAERLSVPVDAALQRHLKALGRRGGLVGDDPLATEAIEPPSVDSYLVHFAVPRPLRANGGSFTAHGEITFDQPIWLVLQRQSTSLNGQLGHPETIYPRDQRTGAEMDLDSGGGNSADAPVDRIVLSSDRRTLHVRLNVRGRGVPSQKDTAGDDQPPSSTDYIDQFRILVMSP